MTTFTHTAYRKELVKIERQLEALRPAARALGVEKDLGRAVFAVRDARIDSLGS
jgi:hypothetical protein